MNFENYLLEQYRLHPSMKAQDVHKLCYQAAHGAEHLLLDKCAAKKYFDEEFENTNLRTQPLYEDISEQFCRVNIAAWKASGLDKNWLFNMFTASAEEKHDCGAFSTYINIAKRVLPCIDFDNYVFKDTAVHHSEEYRAAEKPAYRVVDKRYARLIPILQAINGDTRVIALDGRAASGKTTASECLSRIIGAPQIHMDDFFLPPALRNEARLKMPGGNVHYERFAKEVLPYLESGAEFSYNIFDCSKMELSGKRKVEKSSIRIIEGAYSLHPEFGDYADVKVFFDVAADEQMRRIIARNGEKMAEMFKNRWIPLEEAYYKAYNVKEKADVVVG